MRKKGREERGAKAHSKNPDLAHPTSFRHSLVALEKVLCLESVDLRTQLGDPSLGKSTLIAFRFAFA